MIALDSNKHYSVHEWFELFSDEEVCREYMTQIRWEKCIICPYCKGEKNYITTRGFRCANKECSKKFSLTSGSTIFDNTKIPLKIWLYLIYNRASTIKNVSSCQNALALGIGQATSWQMLHKIRSILTQNEELMFKGIVEVDECYIGASNRWERHRGFVKTKSPILGIWERDTGRVIARVILDRSSEELESAILTYVKPGSTIYTDAWGGYQRLHHIYKHEFLNHSMREYVRGDIHTNNIEGFWAKVKRNIKGAHHYVSPSHLQLYLNEIVYRESTKHMTTVDRFNDMLRRCFMHKGEMTKEKSGEI